MPVNKVLQRIRKEQGYTLDDMARMLGYKSKVTYYNIENNEVKVTLEIACKIASILNTPIPELFPNFFEQKVQETQTTTKSTGTIG